MFPNEIANLQANFSIDPIIAQIASSDSQKGQLESYFVK